MAQLGSCLICATPRTGSTLLCNLLQSSGVAGNPESYFRKQDEATYAARWALSGSRGDVCDYADFVRAARIAGSTDNGFFSARIMWGSMHELVDNLGRLFPSLAGSNFELLANSFGFPRFIHLQRHDVVAQAVSWFRAEQTDIWHRTEQSRSEEQEQKVQFDFDGIHELVQTIGDHNEAWRQWFAASGVSSHVIWYEDLDREPISTTREILGFLELDSPPHIVIGADNVRMADERSARWIDRYQTKIAEG